MAELMGMGAICAKVKRSESTVLNWIRDLDFPAKKVGGIWESTDAKIDTWKDSIEKKPANAQKSSKNRFR